MNIAYTVQLPILKQVLLPQIKRTIAQYNVLLSNEHFSIKRHSVEQNGAFESVNGSSV